ncbi:methyltransferase [Streptomyces albofaciens JCM 4342]|uniref:methyltransferase n=1 Tax=Streptomyces albofaciens TaxID=66866 RepID=UPI00123B58C6|nr:methyltransferase [Streptomyces albofaciens]KAA6214787.1 methyltransferase [Streptomyces albofaciens JCM 4342]
MEANQERAAATRAARGTVTRLLFGQLATYAVGAAVRLGVLDRIGTGTCTADEVAADCGTHPQATLRLLRALAALGLLTEPEPGTFEATAAGALLRSDTPDSMSALARIFSDPLMTRARERTEDSVRSGEPAFDAIFGTDFFGHLKNEPELSQVFNTAMGQGTRIAAEDVPAAYDFGRFGTIVDVGGGDGTLLAAILRAHPAPRGMIYDTAEGLAQADARLAAEGVADRVTLEAGDFFTAAPAGGDLYLLKSVIHDWNDDQCAQILRHIRQVIPADGRLLVIEPVLTDTVRPETEPLIYLSDLNMLVNVGGRERTRADFEDLCAKAGFTLTGLTPLPAPDPFVLIEAAPS